LVKTPEASTHTRPRLSWLQRFTCHAVASAKAERFNNASPARTLASRRNELFCFRPLWTIWRY